MFKKILVLFLLSLSFTISGCSKNETNSGNQNSTLGSAAETTDKNENKQQAKPAEKVEFKKLPFVKKDVPKSMPVDGKLIDGAKWMDANGENTLLVSMKTEKTDDYSKQTLFGYLYLVKDGKTSLLWKIQDWADNYCDEGKGLVSPIEVRDIDGDGVAENLFVYNIEGNCDVSPTSYKLMMHSSDKKYAIRGSNTVVFPEETIKGEKNLDEAFKTAPDSVRNAASEYWDKYVKTFKT